MSFADVMAVAYRNASILVGLGFIFIGFLVRESNETNRGLGMSLVVVGATMIVIASLGRYSAGGEGAIRRRGESRPANTFFRRLGMWRRHPMWSGMARTATPASRLFDIAGLAALRFLKS